MNKDIIYIDVEDDITAIIGKVKASAEKIVALVPPKRIGVLQSAVNLRLLQRAASQENKRIVLITGNQALVGLAAAASIPVARSLQSKPEIAEIPALEVDDGEDIIDGAQLPVGDHAKQARSLGNSDDDATEVIQGIDIENEPPVGPTPAIARKSGKKGAAKKIPNFNSFRKRLVIGILAGVLLIGTLVWALVFAPAATIIITARTAEVSVNDVVRFGNDTNAEQGTIKVATQSLEKESSVEFQATGEKDVGDKATGTVKMSTGYIGNLGTTVPAGTSLSTSGGLVFKTDQPVTFTINNWTGVTVSVTAADRGESYNGATGSLSGAPSNVSASLTGPTSGGTSKKVTIVTASDVQTAKQKLVEQSTDEIKKELTGKFSSNVKIIDSSFNADYGNPSSAPAIGDEAADKKAKLTTKVVYTLSGIEERELSAYLEQTLKKQMQDQTTQKIYSTGEKDVVTSEYTKNDQAQSIRLKTTGQIGPTINEDDVKRAVAGKQFGDVQAELLKINGVNNVDVKFSFFWVHTVPNNPSKITVEFDVNNGSK